MQKYFQKILSLLYVCLILAGMNNSTQASLDEKLLLDEGRKWTSNDSRKLVASDQRKYRESRRLHTLTASDEEKSFLHGINSLGDSEQLRKTRKIKDAAVKIADSIVNHCMTIPSEDFADGYNFYTVYPEAVKRFFIINHIAMAKEIGDPERRVSHFMEKAEQTAYYKRFDTEFFRKEAKSFPILSRVIAIPAGFFGGSAACALFMKFSGNYFGVHVSEEASLASVIVLTTSTTPFMMEFLSDRVKSGMKRAKELWYPDYSEYYFEREGSHKFTQGIVHLLSMTKALMIAAVVYDIERQYGVWAPLFTGGMFLFQYALTAQPAIEITDQLAQNSQGVLHLSRQILLKKLTDFEHQIKTSDELMTIAFHQVYPSSLESPYFRFARLFLPVTEVNAAGSLNIELLDHQAAHFVADLRDLEPSSRLRIFMEGIKETIVTCGAAGRIAFYGYALTSVASPYLAYPLASVIASMQWYGERSIHQDNSDHLSDNISVFTTNLWREPCQTLGSALCSTVKNAPMLIPFVTAGVLSTVIPAAAEGALPEITHPLVKVTNIALVGGTSLLDLSIYTRFFKRTVSTTVANTSAAVMWVLDKGFGCCTNRRQIHQNRLALQADIRKAEKAVRTTFTDQTVEDLSTLIKIEEGNSRPIEFSPQG